MTQLTDCFEGGCTCGHIRYRIGSKPLIVHCCHCSWCQRETGSAFVLNALIEYNRVELLSGEVSVIDTPTHSSKGQSIARCPNCQVALWSHYKTFNQKITFVRVGTLDKPATRHSYLYPNQTTMACLACKHSDKDRRLRHK